MRTPSCSSCDFLLRIGRCAEDDNIVFAMRGNVLHQARIDGQAQARIENHAKQRAAARASAAIRKQRIVRKNRARANHERIVLMPQFLNVRARHFAGDPSTSGSARGPFEFLRGRRRDFSVERHRGLQRNQRRGMADVAGKGLI